MSATMRNPYSPPDVNNTPQTPELNAQNPVALVGNDVYVLKELNVPAICWKTGQTEDVDTTYQKHLYVAGGRYSLLMPVLYVLPIAFQFLLMGAIRFSAWAPSVFGSPQTTSRLLFWLYVGWLGIIVFGTLLQWKSLEKVPLTVGETSEIQHRRLKERQDTKRWGIGLLVYLTVAGLAAWAANVWQGTAQLLALAALILQSVAFALFVIIVVGMAIIGRIPVKSQCQPNLKAVKVADGIHRISGFPEPFLESLRGHVLKVSAITEQPS